MSEKAITRLSLPPITGSDVSQTIDTPLFLDFKNIGTNTVPNNSAVGLGFSIPFVNSGVKPTTAQILNRITENTSDNLSTDLEFSLMHKKNNNDNELKSKMVLSSGSSGNNNDISLNLINPYPGTDNGDQKSFIAFKGYTDANTISTLGQIECSYTTAQSVGNRGKMDFKVAGSSILTLTTDNGIIINNNLTVNGTTTTINSQNTVISDLLYELGNGRDANLTSGDSGIVIERGLNDPVVNAFMGWDDSKNGFTLGTGTFNGSHNSTNNNGNLSITAADLSIANLSGIDINLSGEYQIGGNSVVKLSDSGQTLNLGNDTVTTLNIHNTTIASVSDERDKKDIVDSEYGLEFLKNIHPKIFTWNKRILNEDDEKFRRNGHKELGFIAQNLQSAMKENENSYLNLVHDINPERLQIKTSNLIPILVKAIHDLSNKVDMLEEKLNNIN